MRRSHWLVTAAIGFFVIIDALIGSEIKAQNDPALITPIATVRQIMVGLTVPASDVVFHAVSTVSAANGVEEAVPKTDEAWQAVETNAAMVAESANLLLLRKQSGDQAEWIRTARALVEACKATIGAARTKNADALFASYDGIYAACEACHRKYLPSRQ